MTDANGGMTVAAIVGSLRAKSFNRGLLQAAIEESPSGMTIVEIPIVGLPFYDEDVDVDGGPPSVRRFRQGIADADAVLFFTSEYNYSLSGVLKNAIDWASRPSGQAPIVGKPGAMMGASIGQSGTMRAQLHLRQIFGALDIVGMNMPQIYLPFAGEKFDEDGRLKDAAVHEKVGAFLAALETWIRRVTV